MEKIKIICGPTAIGKSDLACQEALKTEAEIISADAFQIYKELNIGTAKLLPEEQLGIPHHLIDIQTIDTPYSVVDFQHHAQTIIEEKKRTKTPIIICGGTALYLMAFLYQYAFFDHPKTSDNIRKQLEIDYDTHGLNYLLEILKVKDPSSYMQIDKKNPRRVIRALEIIEITGKPASELRQKEGMRQDCDIYCLKMDRTALYERINLRVDKMIKLGLIEEVESLIKKYPEDSPGFQAIGYKQCIDYLKGRMDKKAMIECIKTLTRRFAKRQMTWFKRFENVKWIETT